MTDYMIPADLRPWVERTAPTVTDWSKVEHGAARRGFVWLHTRPAGPMSGRGISISPKRAQALLAYRDEVARGLDQDWLDFVGSEPWAPATEAEGEIADALERLRMAARDGQDFTVSTDWGRVIAERARVLREDGGA